jgi:excisionase family DNA binding protein
MPKMMTVKEVAEYLHIARGTVYRMMRSGQLPAFRIGSDYRIDADAIDRWTKSGGDNAPFLPRESPAIIFSPILRACGHYAAASMLSASVSRKTALLA